MKSRDSDGSDSETSGDVSDGDNDGSHNQTPVDDGDSSMQLNDEAMEELKGSDNHDIESEESDDDGSNLDYDYEYSPGDASGDMSLILNGQKPLTEVQLARIQNVKKATIRVRDVLQKYGNAPLPPSLDPNDASNKDGWKIDKDSAWADTSLALEEIVGAREGLKKAWGDRGDGLGSVSNKKEHGSNNDEWWRSTLTTETSNMNKDSAGDTTIEDRSGYEEPLSKEEQDEFQAVHMEWATNAFAEELEALRKGRLEKTLAANKRQKKKGTAATTEAVELDPTQYSFVVASKKGAGKKDNDGDEEADAIAAAKEIDVQVLADMLQSGSNFLSDTEKRMLLNARQRATTRKMDCDNNNHGDYDGLTLHEQRKRDLGFLVE